eukprot:11160516-Lingulodinium_polyedra.AAC.1
MAAGYAAQKPKSCTPFVAEDWRRLAFCCRTEVADARSGGAKVVTEKRQRRGCGMPWLPSPLRR